LGEQRFGLCRRRCRLRPQAERLHSLWHGYARPALERGAETLDALAEALSTAAPQTRTTFSCCKHYGVRRDLPSGTVTLLFTDVEGSTNLPKELGPNTYAAALSEHRRVLRAAFAAHRGVEVDTRGDSVLRRVYYGAGRARCSGGRRCRRAKSRRTALLE
jgi:class 3 adenylate cyclase